MAKASPERLSSLSSDGDVRRLASAALVKLFDSLYEGAVTIDRAGRITWINDKYKALIGWNGSEPIEGQLIDEVLPNSRLRAVAETGQAELLDVFLIGRRQVVVSRIPLRDEQDELIGALGVILYDRLQALKPIVSKFQQMQSDLASVRQQLAETRRSKYSLLDFVGDSELARRVRDDARRAAKREGAVLLLGETGTGKELIAHAIHGASLRSNGPLVSLNAAAIPENLLESELFGVEPGAFTGAASKARPGKFQLATGGTLFLDEVGDMPLSLQPKLLRVLQEGEVEPLGATRVQPVDVRVIAATSRDLKAMVDTGLFRADLFYRLNVLPLTLPPLRDRLDDLPALCTALLGKLSESRAATVPTVSAEALRQLASYRWPGNVRELQNVLEQASAQSEGSPIDAKHLSGLPATLPSRLDGAVGESGTPVGNLRAVLAAAEKQEIRRALTITGGVKLQAAKLLGISRAQLYEKLAIHGLVSGESDS